MAHSTSRQRVSFRSQFRKISGKMVVKQKEYKKTKKKPTKKVMHKNKRLTIISTEKVRKSV